MNLEEMLDYEDILIKPAYINNFTSRREVLIANSNGHVPVCAANMHGVGTFEMALELGKHDFLTFIQKHYTVDDWDEHELVLNWNCVVPTFGVTENDFDKFKTFIDRFGTKVKYICIDVANGHMKYVVDRYQEYQNYAPDVKFIVGNIANSTVLDIYNKVGIWAAKVGIGGGSVCTTRKITGIGYPQASLVSEMVTTKNRQGLTIKIIADGGIKEIGDIVKALVIGADYVMCGGMFAGYKEGSPESFDLEAGDKILFKGSSAIQLKDYVTPEGKIVDIPYRGEVKDLVKDIAGGLRSAGTYMSLHVEQFPRHRSNLLKVRRQTNEIFKN